MTRPTTTTTYRWTTTSAGRARWIGRSTTRAVDAPESWLGERASGALRLVLALVALLLGVTGSSRADEAPVAGAWRLEGARAERRLEGEDGALSTTVVWPSRGPTGLRGCVSASTVTLAAEVADGRGLTGAVRGDAARTKVVHLSLVGRITRDAEAGDAIAVRMLEDGKLVASERWTRPGPAGLEIVGVSPGGSWAPKKDGELTVTFRVKNRAMAVRFRAELSGDRSRAFYEPLVPPARRLEGGRIAVVDGAAVELEPGEHTLRWDGRDDTGAKRIVLGGPCTLVLEDARAPRDVRAERVITVAEPVVRYLGPRWPRRSAEDGGRDHAGTFQRVTAGFQRLGFANPDAANRQEVGADDVKEALRTSAAVVISTHGKPGGFLLYTDAKDTEERREHIDTIEENDLGLDQLGARGRGEERPYRDVHLVLLWACRAGSAVARDVETGRPIPDAAPGKPAAFVGLPARLRACGVDIVVAFCNSISSGEHGDFMDRLLEQLLQRCSIGAASRAAADFADARYWGAPRADGTRAPNPIHERNRARGGAPLAEALVIFPPDSQTDAERLDPACWGSSTN